MLRVGAWRVFPDQNVIRCAEREVRITPHSMDVLVYLTGHPETTVSANELLDAVWPSVVVGEHSVRKAISELRQALGDESGRHEHIQTVRKRGYRLIARVADGDAARPKAQSRSLAVLPLSNLSDDPAQSYFADGMTESLITELSRLNSLVVTSRTSSARYHDSRHTLPEIARALGVDIIIEGSVLKVEKRLRIFINAIDATNDAHIWSKQFDGELTHVFELHGQIAKEVAGALDAPVDREERVRLDRSRRVDPVALDFYLAGRQAASTRQLQSGNAIASLTRAVEIDPGFALAHIALASAYALLSARDPPRYNRLAKVAAQRAIEIDPDLPEAHAALAKVLAHHDWDYAAAARSYRRAAELGGGDPSHFDSYYAVFLASAAEPVAARAWADSALRRAPADATATFLACLALGMSGERQRASRGLEQLIELEDFGVALGCLAIWSAADGDYEQAANYEIRGLDAKPAMEARKALETQGVEAYWAWQTTRTQDPLWASTHAARTGDLDGAFRYLAQAVESREPELSVVVRHPDRFPPAMVRDPRWKRTMAPVGIPSVDPADVMMPLG